METDKLDILMIFPLLSFGKPWLQRSFFAFFKNQSRLGFHDCYFFFQEVEFSKLEKKINSSKLMETPAKINQKFQKTIFGNLVI